jgi:hypothetical protein
MTGEAGTELEEALRRRVVDEAAVRKRMYRAPTPRERERWHASWLALQGWSSARVAGALERDPHTVSIWLADCSPGGSGGPGIWLADCSPGGSGGPGLCPHWRLPPALNLTRQAILEAAVQRPPP